MNLKIYRYDRSIQDSIWKNTGNPIGNLIWNNFNDLVRNSVRDSILPAFNNPIKMFIGDSINETINKMNKRDNG